MRREQRFQDRLFVNDPRAASSIMIDSGLAATTSETSLPSSSVWVGLTTILPSTRPIRTDATGPLWGMSETSSAAEAAISESMSGSLSRSADSTVTMIWVSQS